MLDYSKFENYLITRIKNNNGQNSAESMQLSLNEYANDSQYNIDTKFTANEYQQLLNLYDEL
jgi:hypothetical protein